MKIWRLAEPVDDDQGDEDIKEDGGDEGFVGKEDALWGFTFVLFIHKL